MSSDLEALLEEHRKFEPPEAFRAAALLSDADVYDRAGALGANAILAHARP